MPLKLDVEIDPEVKCVLVVEDDAVVRMVVSEAIRDAGFHVVEVSSGGDAIDYLRSGAAVDLIFSDIHMAGPFDGLLLASHVQAIYPSTPVILSSAMPKPAGLQGSEMFIAKPYTIDRVVTAVTYMLNALDSRVK